MGISLLNLTNHQQTIFIFSTEQCPQKISLEFGIELHHLDLREQQLTGARRRGITGDRPSQRPVAVQLQLLQHLYNAHCSYGCSTFVQRPITATSATTFVQSPLQLHLLSSAAMAAQRFVLYQLQLQLLKLFFSCSTFVQFPIAVQLHSCYNTCTKLIAATAAIKFVQSYTCSNSCSLVSSSYSAAVQLRSCSNILLQHCFIASIAAKAAQTFYYSIAATAAQTLVSSNYC